MKQITDPDVLILAASSLQLQPEFMSLDAEWAGSPFAWIKTRPSRQVGTIAEKMVAGWLATKGFDVQRSPDSQADRLINGVRAEIKFSTLWKSGSYKFQQLRDQDYEFVICLGVSPFDAHCWVIPKRIILENWGNAAGLQSQHGGQGGRDTAWLAVTPGKAPAWLAPYGSRLADAAKLIEKITGRPPV